MKAQFPDHFIGLKKFPGYYWHSEEKRLYSLKTSGVLKPLTLNVATNKTCYAIARRHRYVPYDPGDRYYRIYHKGKRYSIFPDKIEKYLEPNKVVPVQGELF